MSTPSPVLERSPDPAPESRAQPVCLSDAQMSAILAASHPLPPNRRSAFLADVARELAVLAEIGDGALHRIVTVVQRRYFDPPLEQHHGGKYAR